MESLWASAIVRSGIREVDVNRLLMFANMGQLSTCAFQRPADSGAARVLDQTLLTTLESRDLVEPTSTYDVVPGGYRNFHCDSCSMILLEMQILRTHAFRSVEF